MARKFDYKEYLAEGWMFKEAGEPEIGDESEGTYKYTFVGFYVSRGELASSDFEYITLLTKEPINQDTDFYDIEVKDPEDEENEWTPFYMYYEEFWVTEITDESGKTVYECPPDPDFRDDIEDFLNQGVADEELQSYFESYLEKTA